MKSNVFLSIFLSVYNQLLFRYGAMRLFYYATNMKLMFSFYSAEMLVNLGIPWVILGHSERRALLNESNEVSIAAFP